MLAKYYMGGAFPPFLLGIIFYFFYPQFILSFSMSYFICWALFLPELEEKTKRRSYRYSFLRFLFFLFHRVDRWQNPRWGRVLCAMIILLPTVFFVGAVFTLIYLIGIAVFEIWFSKFDCLHKFPQRSGSEQVSF
jgi:hypothetical protein